jgi:hypothetical protein
MIRRPGVRTLAVYGLALAGVLVGHAVTYTLLLPDAHQRATELAATGHAYLVGLQRVVVAVALVGLAVTFLGRLVRPGGPLPRGGSMRRILSFQLAAFATMEIAERIGSGSSFGDLTRILPLGLAVQAVVALGVAGLLVALLRAADRTAAALSASPSVLARPAIAVPLPAGPALVRASLLAVPGRRGPPGTR